MKHLQSCLRATKDGECSFHHSGSLVKHVQACLSAGKVRQSHFNHCRGLVKLVQAHFSVRKDRESCLVIRADLFKCQEGPTKPF